MRVGRLLSRLAMLLVVAMCASAFGAWSAPVNLGPEINTAAHETGVFLAPDESFIIFAANGPGCLGVTDLYISYHSINGWGAPIHLGGEVNTPAKENEPYLNASGTVLYFISERTGGLGGADIWAISWNNGPVGTAVNLGPNVNSPAGEYTVAITPDGNELWFSSTRDGGYGGADMYVCQNHVGYWQPAMNVGMPLNTPFDDGGMAFTADGQTMVLVSDDQSGFGAYEIMLATKSGGVWMPPINAGCGVNSELTDWSPHISGDGDQIYYTPFERSGGFGASDIWVSSQVASGPNCGKELRVTPSTQMLSSLEGSTLAISGYVVVSSKSGTALDFGLVESTDWLSCTPELGSTPQTVTVNADPSGMTAGEYSAVVHVTSSDPEVIPTSFIVNLSIMSAATCGGWPIGVNIGAPVNTSENETKPFWTDSDQTLYFSSARSESIGNYDIFVSYRNGANWSQPINLGLAINSSSHDDNPCVSAAGDRMVFISRRDGGSAVYMSEKLAGIWQPAVRLGPQVNIAENVWTVGLNPAGDEIIISATASGTLGQADMYRSRYVNGQWTPAEHLPAPFNSSADDGSVYYSKDGAKVYFVSQRNGGFGAYDFWEAAILPNGEFGVPQNLGCPVNTPGFEVSLAVNSDDTKMIYASSEMPGLGGSDFYESTFDPNGVGADEIQVQPQQLVFYGVVGQASPPPQALTLTAVPGNIHDWSASVVAPWITVNPTSGNTPTLATVAVTSDGLAVGVYVDTVRISSLSATNDPVNVPIELRITETPGGEESEDTVRVENVMALPGDQDVVVTVSFYAQFETQAYVLPLAYDPSVLTIQSVDFVGTASAELDPPIANLNTGTLGTMIVGGVCIFPPFIPAGEQILARLHFSVATNAPNGVYPITTTFVPPAGNYEFIIGGVSSVPYFKPGSVTVASYYRGDYDFNSDISIADAVGLLNVIFGQQALPLDAYRLDANCSGTLSIADPVYLIGYIFAGGNAPCPLFGGSKLNGATESASFTISVADNGREEIEVEVVATSAEPLAASQVLLRFDPTQLELIAASPDQDLGDLNFYERRDGDAAMLGLLDLDGQAMIPAGTHPQYRLKFRRTGSGDLLNAISAPLVVAVSRDGLDLRTTALVSRTTGSLPRDYSVSANYPNPFNPSTSFDLSLPVAGEVRVEVFNALGQTVKTLLDAPMAPGVHRLGWDGTDNSGSTVASGVYFYRVQSGSFNATRKMLLLK